MESFYSVIDHLIEQIYWLGKYAEPTVILVPGFIKDVVLQISGAIGFDVETLNFVLGLFLCYPMGLILNLLPHGKARHFFSFLMGAFLLQFILGVQWIHQMITSLICYVMFLVVPRDKVQVVVPIFVMTYMTLGHLHRQYINYLGWDLDFTSSQMVLTQKLYEMAYNLHDGDALARGKADRAAKKCEKYAIKQLPGIIEYLGYTFCFANCLAGPVYEFNTYRQACDGTLLYTPDGKPRGKIPSNVMPTLIPFLKSIVCMGLFVVLGGAFPLLDPLDPQGNRPILVQPQFLENSWIYRYAYMWIGLLGVRQKYYFAWTNAEGANNVWYAGFEGFDEKGNALGWGNANNIDILGFETAPSISTLSKDWNKKTSVWLSRYVYMRTNGNLMAVYGLSAFWHGFYPGYYLFFLSIPVLTMCERLSKKKISPYFSEAKWSPYGILCIFTTSFFVEYMVSAFIVLAMDRTIDNWKSHYFFGHVLGLSFYVILMLLPSPKKDDKEKTQ